MKEIIVVDDYPEVHAEWRRTLRGRWPDERERPAVVDLHRPEEVAAALRDHPEAGLVVVDLDFGRTSRRTGLLALQEVERHQHRYPDRDISTVVMTADEQDNRLLLLMAAFQLFDPAPVDLIRKSADRRDRRIMEVVETLRSGLQPRNTNFSEYVHEPGTRVKSTVMRRLICEPYGRGRRALDLWRALLEANSTTDLKDALGLGNHIYQYMRKAADAASEIAHRMQNAPRALLDADRLIGEDGVRRGSGDAFVPLSGFAQSNALFFSAAELPAIAAKFDK
ncbi:hypothetical protein ACWDUH_04965 [Micromonospora wenchangensis]